MAMSSFKAGMVGMVALACGLAGCAVAPSAPPRVHNGLGMTLVRIPAGEFVMGRDESVDRLAQDFPGVERSRLEALTDEAPAHRVRITRAFYLGQHEVTVGQFRRFLAASGHVPESVADGTGGYGYNPAYDPATTARGDAFEGRHPRYSWANPGFEQGDDHPVVNVSFNDAMALARWLSRQEGRTYRLPTEAEWEYACQAGTGTRYGVGDAPGVLAAHANTFDARSAVHWPRWQAQALPADDGHAFTAPVGRYPPNAFGVHDMVGNVWEWVSDRHDDGYYARSPVDDPTGPADAEGGPRVRRGGSWHTWALYARCSFRNINTDSSRYPLLGLRLLLEDPAAGR
jgi:formylglycine-generating enzyme